MTEQKKYKDLPEGIESFNELISEGCYFVDKTSYIKTILVDGKRSVFLITRPRRFGKTLFMTMMADFLRINALNPDDKENTRKLFNDTAIFKDKEFTDKYLGNYPVISISLKSVDATTYDAAYEQLADVITELVKQLSYLKNSNALSDINKVKFNRLSDIDYIKNQRNIASLGSAIRDVASCLYEHFKRQVIVLIDEYDVPLAKAAVHGFHEDMVSLISTFLNFMKIDLNSFDGRKPIYKIIMTGCLKVAKNSIFTGVNNLRVNTVLDDDDKFSSMIGFNKAEVIKMLDDYDMSNYIDIVKENYDGYRFNEDEMFCPWDVVNFLADNYQRALKNKEVKAKNYWNSSSSASSTFIKDYLDFLSDDDIEKLQDLVDGKTIDVNINDSTNYDSLVMHNADDFFSLLLYTGYLTSVGNVDGDIYTVKIPNREIFDCFKENIMAYFKASLNSNGENKSLKLAKALLNGDRDTASNIINDRIQRYVSIRDLATKANKENFYHGFLSGVFSNCPNFIKEYKSNTETGKGYADITFMDYDKAKAVIIEIKVSKDEGSLIDDAKIALLQIEKQKYKDAFLRKPNMKEIICYGLSFVGKDFYLIKA